MVSSQLRTAEIITHTFISSLPQSKGCLTSFIRGQSWAYIPDQLSPIYKHYWALAVRQSWMQMLRIQRWTRLKSHHPSRPHQLSLPFSSLPPHPASWRSYPSTHWLTSRSLRLPGRGQHLTWPPKQHWRLWIAPSFLESFSCLLKYHTLSWCFPPSSPFPATVFPRK